MAKTVKYTIYCGFSSLSDIDKITHIPVKFPYVRGFSSLSDIDKITPVGDDPVTTIGFSSLSDIDKITLSPRADKFIRVLVHCRILIKSHQDFAYVLNA